MNDQELVTSIKEITQKGNSAEVKRDCDGKWVVYDVKKNKRKAD